MNVYEKRRATVEPCEPEGHTFEGMTGYCDVCGVDIAQAYKDAAAKVEELLETICNADGAAFSESPYPTGD